MRSFRSLLLIASLTATTAHAEGLYVGASGESWLLAGWARPPCSRRSAKRRGRGRIEDVLSGRGITLVLFLPKSA